MSTNPQRRADLLEQSVGDELMLYDVTGRVVHVLNGTARYVWERCDGAHTTEQILAEAVKDFSVEPEVVQGDLTACLREFRELGLLEATAAESPGPGSSAPSPSA